MPPSASPAGGVRTVVVAGGSSVLGAVPPFLVGSMAVFMREDLRFDQSQLGLSVAAFFLASAVAALPGGRVTERVGARRAILGAATASGVAMLGIATLTHSWPQLVGWLVLAGAANGVAQPAGNLALARGVAQARQGAAFGIKQASIPAATLVAGAAVPVVALTVGWRWAFAGAALGALALAIVMPGDPYASSGARGGRRMREGDTPMKPLIVLAIAATCGASVGTSLASFFVESAVDSGVAPGPAGVLLVVGSLAGIGSRLVLGWSADRRERGHLGVVTVLLGLGAVGFLGLANSQWTTALILGTLLAFAAGWGWPGLFNFAVVRLNRNAPAAATSVTQTGVFAGGVLGPAAFGAVAEATSFFVAWTAAAGLNVLGAGCVILGRRMLRASRPGSGGQHTTPPSSAGPSGGSARDASPEPPARGGS